MTWTAHRCPKIGIRHAAAALAGLLTALLTFAAMAPACGAATTTRSAGAAADTSRIQALLDHPANGTVNLPGGTFTVRPTLRLSQGERIVGHHTTLKVAAHSGNYAAMLAGATPGTSLSGLTITGVTFNQNAAANPITSVQALYHGKPRFVLLISLGSDVRISGNRFTGTNNVNTVVTGSATRNVAITGNTFAAINTPVHDHSTIYTSGIGTTISQNSFAGTSMAHSAAIEVHGDSVSVTGNLVRGYYRGANIVASHTTFSHNQVIGAVNPVDLWSVAAPGLSHVAVTHNRLGRNLSYWTRLLGGVPPARYTRQVIRDASSTYPFHSITIMGNTG